MYISPHQLPRLKKLQILLYELASQPFPRALTIPGSVIPRGNIIVFPGFFNPPTFAHLALLKQAQRFTRNGQERHEKRPWRVYASFSLHTVDKERVSRPLLLDRVYLLQKVLRRRLPDIGILLCNRGLYVEQAMAIREAFPRVRRLVFLMGFDKVEQILDERYYEDRDGALEELFRLSELLVAPRGQADSGTLTVLLDQPQNRRFARFIHALAFDPAYKEISSTRVRQDGMAYPHDLPQEVRYFMRMTRAYAPPVKGSDGRLIDVYDERIASLRELLHGPVL
jgi:nicotinic acid mononucleotide adenylyltransferase